MEIISLGLLIIIVILIYAYIDYVIEKREKKRQEQLIELNNNYTIRVQNKLSILQQSFYKNDWFSLHVSNSILYLQMPSWVMRTTNEQYEEEMTKWLRSKRKSLIIPTERKFYDFIRHNLRNHCIVRGNICMIPYVISNSLEENGMEPYLAPVIHIEGLRSFVFKIGSYPGISNNYGFKFPNLLGNEFVDYLIRETIMFIKRFN